MEKRVQFWNHLFGMPADEIIMSSIAMLFGLFAAFIVILLLALLFSWLNFIFMPEIEGAGTVIDKIETAASKTYSVAAGRGEVFFPAEYRVYLMFQGKKQSLLVSKDNFQGLNLGDEVRVLYEKGLVGGIRISRIAD